jgi:hypothetical protein
MTIHPGAMRLLDNSSSRRHGDDHARMTTSRSSSADLPPDEPGDAGATISAVTARN